MENGYNNDSWFGIFGIIALLSLGGGGLFGGNGRYGANDYSNELQTTILEASANQRQTCMDFANTNSNIVNGNYQTQNAINNGFTQNARDIATASNGIVQAIRNNAESLQGQLYTMQMNHTAEIQSIKDMIQQNKIETLQGQLNNLQLQNALCGVVRYPNAMTYNAGTSPFCTCNSCGC